MTITKTFLISNVQSTGEFVSDQMFGANALHDINIDTTGAASPSFVTAISEMGVTDIRYPGGFAEVLGDILEGGVYQLGLNAIYRYRNSSKARLRTRLIKNSSTVLNGTQREVSSGHLNNMTGLNTVTLAALNEGDQISMQAHYRSASAYLLANETCFWGFKVG